MIIGITGLAGSGKDSAAKFIMEKYPEYVRLSFASKLKDITSLLYNWNREALEGLTEKNRVWREEKDKKLSKIFNREITPRHELQLIGTGLKEILQKDFWSRIIEHKIITENLKNVVITDVRFPDEIEMIKRLGGHIIEIRRIFPTWYTMAYKANQGKLSFIDKIFNYRDYREYLNIHASEKSWIGVNNPDLIITNPFGDLNLLKISILAYMEENS